MKIIFRKPSYLFFTLRNFLARNHQILGKFLLGYESYCKSNAYIVFTKYASI